MFLNIIIYVCQGALFMEVMKCVHKFTNLMNDNCLLSVVTKIKLNKIAMDTKVNCVIYMYYACELSPDL